MGPYKFKKPRDVELSANVADGSWSCKNAPGKDVRMRLGWRNAFIFGRSLCPHRGHERLDAHDVHHAGEIVGEHVQCHL